jgi:PAS domain S-box-containing protein
MANTARLVSYLLVGLIIGLGVFVMLGWHARQPALVQVLPHYVPMPYGAALCFLLTGLGMLAVLRRSRRIAAVFGMMLTVAGGLPMLQHLFEAVPQIDNFLVRPFVTDDMPVSERMPFSAAFSFTLIGIFLACSLLKIAPLPRLRFHWILGSWLMMLGLLALTGYIADLYDGYGWGALTKLALHTSIGFLMVGLAIIASRLDRHIGATLKSNYRLLAMGTLVMFVIAGFNWKIVETWEYRRIDELIAARFESAAEHLDHLLAFRLYNLREIGLLLARDKDQQDFLLALERETAEFDALKSLLYLDPDFNTLQVIRGQGQASAIMEINRTFASAKSDDRKRDITLIRHDENSIIAVIPLIEEGVVDGYLAGDIHVPTLFVLFEADDLLNSNRMILASCAEAADRPAKWHYTHPLAIGNGGWVLTLSVSTASIKRFESVLPEVMLGFGALLITAFVWTLISYHNQIRLRRHMKSVLEATPTALIESDIRGRIMLVNSAAAKLFGYSEKELASMFVEDLVPENHRAQHEIFRQEFYARSHDKQLIPGRNLVAITRDGREIPVEIGLSALQTEEGIRVLSAIVDISERKRHEETIAEHARKLEAVNQELERFAYSASHDLKSPLRAIENLAAWIEEDAGEVLPEKSREDLAMLRNRVARMGHLLDSLLEYSRVGRLDYRYEDIDCAALMNDIIGVLNVPENFSVQIVGAMPVIHAPRAPMEMVLRNLVSNAIKHHDGDRGVVHVSIKDCGEFIEIFVKDDGPGILPKYHKQIFQIFQTLKPRDGTDSSGMGLSMVKKIVEGYGGVVKVDSDPSTGIRGTTFIVQWPCGGDKL